MNDKSDKGFVLRIKINQYFIFVLNVKKKNIKNKNKRKIISLKPFQVILLSFYDLVTRYDLMSDG
jgi:hypothetical protein